MYLVGNGLRGSGADAAPYFRIFNPILQGENLIRVVSMLENGFQN